MIDTTLDEIERLPTGHMTAFDASDGSRYLVVAPTDDVPEWEVYGPVGPQKMPQIKGSVAERVLSEYFSHQEA